MSDQPEKIPPQDLLDWLGLNGAPNWALARPLGKLFGALLVLIFFAAVAAAVSVLFGTIRDVFWSDDGAGPNLGAGALVTAILGAPFLIWGTIIRHQSLRYQKEGHMTDRISKAVEQLGAEKKVDRIGRPVVIRYTPPGDPLFEDREIGPPVDRTDIEWRGESIRLARNERIVEKGDWQAFAETRPNLEVRIGAILSLERIAQDSTTHDKGRDHVRVMEILCAYIRENAPASTAQDHPFGDWEPLKDDPTEEERAKHLIRREERFGSFFLISKVFRWAQALTAPREDIALTLKVIGRRTPAQLRVEAAWPNPPGETTIHPADTPCPALPDVPGDAPLSFHDLEAFRADLEDWTEAVRAYAGYRLDLRGTNLQRGDFMQGNFVFCRFDGARMDGASLSQTLMTGGNLSGARLQGADLSQTRMQGAILAGARMERANLRQARAEGANLLQARMEGTELGRARTEGADLKWARMEGATLWEAHMEGADLSNARLEDTDFTFARMRWANLEQTRLDGANLCDARLEGTSLWRARLAGVYLGEARMSDRTNLKHAIFQGVGLQSVDWSSVEISQAQVDASFGDRSVILPDRLTRPRHWPDWELPHQSEDGGPSYDSELVRWRADPANYRPPPPP